VNRIYRLCKFFFDHTSTSFNEARGAEELILIVLFYTLLLVGEGPKMRSKI
jgi:hypothetical protein